MLLDYLNALPPWARQAVFSSIALLAAYAVGRFLSHIKKLHVRYQQEGITIPFPTRTVLTESTG